MKEGLTCAVAYFVSASIVSSKLRHAQNKSVGTVSIHNLLFQVSPAQRHLLLQLLQLAIVLGLGLHLDLALVGIEQLHLLLQLLPQGLALGFLGLVQTQLTPPTADGIRGRGRHKGAESKRD